MDQVLGEEGRMNPKFNQVPYNNAKSDLNRALREANPEYQRAMTAVWRRLLVDGGASARA